MTGAKECELCECPEGDHYVGCVLSGRDGHRCAQCGGDGSREHPYQIACLMLHGRPFRDEKPTSSQPDSACCECAMIGQSLDTGADARDAARYRWLRDHRGSNRLPHVTQYPYLKEHDRIEYPQISKVGLDAAVDGAMQMTSEPKPACDIASLIAERDSALLIAKKRGELIDAATKILEPLADCDPAIREWLGHE